MSLYSDWLVVTLTNPFLKIHVMLYIVLDGGCIKRDFWTKAKGFSRKNVDVVRTDFEKRCVFNLLEKAESELDDVILRNAFFHLNICELARHISGCLLF